MKPPRGPDGRFTRSSGSMRPSADARRRIAALVARGMSRRRAIETVAAEIHNEYAAPERPPNWRPADIGGRLVKPGDPERTLDTSAGQDDPEIREILG